MASERSLDPDRIPDTEFATSFRGFDPSEVRAYLLQVSELVRTVTGREGELRQQLDWATQRVAELEAEVEAARVHAADEGREQGREMVAEARAVRTRMLKDLARRRRQARIQLEQLMAGRDRLLEEFGALRQTIDEAARGMRVALPEARSAAEAVGRRADPEDEDEAVETLEAEIEVARLAGLPLVDEPEPPAEPEPDLLGERDISEMPEVEPAASFEEVRIVEPDEDPEEPDEDPEEPEEPEQEPESDAQVDELFAKLRESQEEASEPEAPESDTAVNDAAEGFSEQQETGGRIAEGGDAGGGAEEPGPHARRDVVVADQQNDALDALRRRRKNETLDVDAVLGAKGEVVAAWAAVAKSPLQAVAAAGVAFLGQDDGGEPIPDVGGAARDLAEELVESLRERVEHILAEVGEDSAEASQSIRATFREWKTQRVGEAAEHHVLAAFSGGIYAGIVDTTPLSWMVEGEHPSCSDCDDNALGGPVPRGEAFPTGHLHPPAHAGCRCLALPADS